MENKITFDVQTPGGTGILQNVYKTDLGLIMAKVFFPERQVWINYRFSEINCNLKKINVESLKTKKELNQRK